MSELRELPLFPLHTVLFPGMVLPLHIFEPRYKMMVGECIRVNQPFGVVLIRKGREVGEPATPFMVGTSAYITQVERLADGRMNIQSVGYQRFKIHELIGGRPYLIGKIEDNPLPALETPEVKQLTEQLALRLRGYLAQVEKAGIPNLSLPEMPQDGLALAYLTAILLPIRSEEKQIMLEADDLLTLLTQQAAVLRRETLLLGHMLIHDQPYDPSAPFSLN